MQFHIELILYLMAILQMDTMQPSFVSTLHLPTTPMSKPSLDSLMTTLMVVTPSTLPVLEQLQLVDPFPLNSFGSASPLLIKMIAMKLLEKNLEKIISKVLSFVVVVKLVLITALETAADLSSLPMILQIILRLSSLESTASDPFLVEQHHQASMLMLSDLPVIGSKIN